MADNKLDASYGIKTADTPKDTAPPGLLDPKSVGAKTLQSATFGFGADAAGLVFGHQAESAIRDLEKGYDKAHPLASMGIDLAVAVAEGSLTGGTSGLVSGGLKGVAKASAMGGAFGALHGAGQGGTMEQRGERALNEGAVGAAGGAALGAVGSALKPLGERLGKMGFSAERGGAQAIQAVLKKEGRTPQELESFMRQNPQARIADFSPAVADLVGEAGGISQKSARTLGTSVRDDMSAQQGRLQGAPSSPLAHVKQTMLDNLKDLQANQKKAYDTAYSEVTPLTPELKAALDHPDVKPLVQDTLDDYRKLRMRASSAPAQAPKYKVGEEIPSAVVDDLQKRIGDMARDPAAIGKMKAGALQTAQSMLKAAQPATLDRAQRLAATVGSVDQKSGITGAQDWGHQFAFGLKDADIEQWRAMNPLQRQYAALGMTSGMERYLSAAGSMGEKRLRDIGDRLGKDAEIREVLGPKEANQMKKVFIAEADRARASVTMASGGSKRAQFKEEDVGRGVAHMANVGIPGAHSVVGTGVRVLKSLGMPEERAIAIINTATKPGGLAQLQKQGLDKGTLDRVAKLVANKGVGGRMSAQEEAKSERQ